MALPIPTCGWSTVWHCYQLSDDVIDSFGILLIILKNVFELEEELEFQLLNNHGKIHLPFFVTPPTAIDFGL